MAKKLRLKIDYFDEYHLLAIASHMKDYRMAYCINQKVGSHLKKFDDLAVGNSEEDHYSWYFCYEKEDHSTLYLISNSNGIQHLIPTKREIDYFLLIKNAVNEVKVGELARQVREVENVIGVFQMDMTTIKDMDVLLEIIELHEMEQLKNKTKQK